MTTPCAHVLIFMGPHVLTQLEGICKKTLHQVFTLVLNTCCFIIPTFSKQCDHPSTFPVSLLSFFRVLRTEEFLLLDLELLLSLPRLADLLFVLLLALNDDLLLLSEDLRPLLPLCKCGVPPLLTISLLVTLWV